MAEEKKEDEILLPEENKSETEKIVESIISSIETDLPSNVDYVTGILTDEDRNVLIIKKGKIYVGKSLEDAKPIKEYMKNADVPFLINALYILKDMLPSYKDMWSGKLEEEARKKYNEIF
ncbi:conserved hypothetical protein [Betalipothrixvirus acidiani]|uniref:Uncharacterized protein n=2 Tax=Betalipothrixvirus TaxID=341940 RepID=A7WKI6_9VIRU|nr:hypothetical protein AFV6_gp32 [Acidianus filamentous virus 6]YP_001604373.1 hypothetical protein AFV3_gp31 [Acidianus filamentous virus 3]CAJ31521.1 conserved hypothetical protein [Acidianus filamentous virus 3]CAJ31586.1 conserved hypothetical protein [Acidianus filamentous virus 6]